MCCRVVISAARSTSRLARLKSLIRATKVKYHTVIRLLNRDSIERERSRDFELAPVKITIRGNIYDIALPISGISTKG